MKREWTIKELEAFDAGDHRPEPPGPGRAAAGAGERVPPAPAAGETRAVLLEGPARRGHRAQAHAEIQSGQIRTAPAGAGAPDGGAAALDPRPRRPKPADVKGPLSGETILLAQVTNDLYDERDQVLAYLQQFGAKVLPEGDYKQGGPEFAEAFKADLAQAGLFVQLLGPYRSNRPPDLKDEGVEPSPRATPSSSTTPPRPPASRCCNGAAPTSTPPPSPTGTSGCSTGPTCWPWAFRSS